MNVHALEAQGEVWLHAQQAAEALGYAKKDRIQVVQRHVRPEHRQPRHALEEGSAAEDTYLSEAGFHTLCAKCPRVEMAQALQDAVAEAVRQKREEAAEARVVVQQQPPPQGWDARCSRLQAISHAFAFYDRLEPHIQSRLKTQAQRYVSELCLPEDEGPEDAIDARQILKERGCSEAQVARLCGELGKDLLAVSRTDEFAATRVNHGQRGPLYHRTRDAQLVETVMQSFRQRDLWRRVMGPPDELHQRRTEQLASGRGRRGTERVSGQVRVRRAHE
jgi:hypothetical protein